MAPIRDLYFLGMETKIDDEMGGEWDDIIMHVLPGSEAERYAVNHNQDYVVIQKNEM